jgi:hypothetical protein
VKEDRKDRSARTPMLLLDAYNLLHTAAAADASLAELDLKQVVALLGTSRYRAAQAFIVCDGRMSRSAADVVAGEAVTLLPPAMPGVNRVQLPHWHGLPAGGQLWFSGSSLEADDAIEHVLATSKGVAGVVVVSSDRRIIKAAKKFRAKSISSDTFLLHLLHDAHASRTPPLPPFATDIPLDKYSVAHWLREFGLPEPDLSAITTPRPDPLPRPAAAKVKPKKRGASIATSPAKAAFGTLGIPGLSDAVNLKAAATPDGTPVQTGPAQGASTGSTLPVAPNSALPASFLAAVDGPGVPKADGNAPREVWISEALHAWAGRLNAEDLEMQRWLKDERHTDPKRKFDG